MCVCPSVRPLNFTKEDKVDLSVFVADRDLCGCSNLSFGSNREVGGYLSLGGFNIGHLAIRFYMISQVTHPDMNECTRNNV